MTEKQIKATFYIAEGKLEQLRTLSERTRIRQADYFREAIDDLLEKYRTKLQETADKTALSRKRKP